MASIGLAIGDIVDQVDDAGQRAKHPEPCRRVEDRVRIEEALPEEQAAEDDEILRPLPRTERSNEVPGNGPRNRTQLALARLGLIENVRNTVSRHLQRGGYVRGLANCRSS